MDGRKVTRDKENPIDNILIDFATFVNPYLHSYGVTANMLTAASFLFGILSSVLIYYNKFEFAAVVFMIAYTFDSMDGNMARMFNEVSEFGDKLDHYTDLIQVILTIIVIAINRELSYKFKVVLFIVMVVISSVTAVHIGCQEKHYDENSNDTLTIFKALCTDKQMIYYTRYIGGPGGTLNLTFSLFLLFGRYIK
jgi:phosphatidylglycerophosphate synthase